MHIKTKTKKRQRALYNDKIIQKEEIAFINVYAPNKGTPRYVKQILKD